MKYVLLIASLTAGPAAAQAVVVKSGDHADFTRLVLTFPQTSDWKLGRTENGYELQRATSAQAFDLTEVYRLITKDRLKSIWVDPANGRLQLGVDCVCHAIPFELDQNTVVIDIRDGAPPDGSAFEMDIATDIPFAPLSETYVAPVPEAAEARPGYDWRDLPVPNATTELRGAQKSPSALRPLLSEEIQETSLRQAVINQLADGATDGIVEISPKGLDEASASEERGLANTHITSGEQSEPVPGISVSDGASETKLTEQGNLCPMPDRVDLGTWPIDEGAEGFVTARAAMLGEFDQPNDAALEMAFRTYLYAGFGAEARNLVTAFQPRGDIDPLALGISYLVDAESPPDNPFSGMQTCDSGAAFWALVAARPSDHLVGVNGNAVARTFATLPRHLKLAMAQTTAEGLMRVGDRNNAEIVRAALSRAAPENAAIVPLLDAEMALHVGNPREAESKLDTISDPTVAIDTLLARIEARFQQRLALEENDIAAVKAFAFEANGGPRNAAFQRALTHANALGGYFHDAFQAAEVDRELQIDVWELLGALGHSEDFLDHTIGTPPEQRDQIPVATRAIFARKLVDLGLPNAARFWVPDDSEDAVLSAEVALANRDGRTALRRLASTLPEADQSLMATALRDTGEYAQAASVLRQAGNTEEAVRMERWAGLWDLPGLQGAQDNLTADERNVIVIDAGAAKDVWNDLAAVRAPLSDVPDSPQLEAAKAQLDASTSTRSRIADLLSSVPKVVK